MMLYCKIEVLGEEIYPSVTLSITNPTYNGVGLNLDLLREKSVLTV